MNIHAEFSDRLRDVWMLWEPARSQWEHEARDLTNLFWSDLEQPPEFIEWQESIFSWVKEKWSDWIVPRYTYRLGGNEESSAKSAERTAQWLADLLGKNVAGFEPRPPVISPRGTPGDQNSKDR